MGEGKLHAATLRLCPLRLGPLRSGSLQVGALLVALLGAAPPALAQGPVYRERWGYLYLEHLRGAVRQELQGRDAATRAEVARLLAEPDGGVPSAPPARALAHLRGVTADDAFVLRATLGVFPLPEIVDPVGDNEVCRKLNATLFLPFTVASPGALSFVVEVRDAAGAAVFGKTVDTDTAIDDLRRARPVVAVDAAELADGEYELRVRALVDGQEPRAQDPRLQLRFSVLRGYQHRAEAAMNATRDAVAKLDGLPRTELLGLAAEVSRTYQGEAYDHESTARLDLERLEAALANVAGGRAVLDGLAGDVPIALPVGDAQIRCVLRRHADDAVTAVARPLLVVAGAAPVYDLTARRPTGPSTTGPRALAAALPALGRDPAWHVAFLESPGLGLDFHKALPEALAGLRELLHVDAARVVLVCDRDAAAITGFSLPGVRAAIGGLVLVGAGAMTPASLECVGTLPVRIAALAGCPSSDGLRRTMEFVQQQRATGKGPEDFAWLTEEAMPWPLGLPLLEPAIAAFAAQVFGR